MPVQYLVTDKGTLVIELWTGVISREEMLSHEKKQLQDDSITQGASVIVDARKADFSNIPYETATDLVKIYDDKENITSIIKSAILVRNADYDKARRLEDEAARGTRHIIVFNSLEIACIWLGKDPDRIRKLIDSLAGK